MEKLVIVWLWWGWYTAAIYAARYWLSPLMIWREEWWMIVWNHMVENFPWYPESVSWWEIMENMKKQSQNFDVRYMQDIITEITPIDSNDLSKWYTLKTSMNWTVDAKMLILAIWTEKVKLNAVNEKEFFWRWVSYCATCDWFFYRWKDTAVVWWWDTAMIEALYLAEICNKVYLIHRRNQFRWEPIWLERIKSKWNIEIITPAVVKEIRWESKVQSLLISKALDSEIYSNTDNVEDVELPLDWLFVAVWTIPHSLKWIDDYLKRDWQRYIEVDSHMRTNLPWVFSAWDCSTWSWKFRQLVVACWEWAVASESAFQYYSKTFSN